MPMTKVSKTFGHALRRYINSNNVFRLLADGDWGAGGCWTLAEALAEYLGPPAQLITVSEQRMTKDSMIKVPVSHIVVRFNDLFIDYNGVQTRTELLENLRRTAVGWSERETSSATLLPGKNWSEGCSADSPARDQLATRYLRPFQLPLHLTLQYHGAAQRRTEA